MRKRTELSVMNLLFCVLVVFIHVASWSLPVMDKHTAAYVGLLIPWRLSAFVVQGFLFLSGVKLFLSDKPFSYGKFLSRRLTKILLPYILFVAVYYLFFHFHPFYRYPFALRTLADYLVHGSVTSHLYFVVALLQFYLLMPLWKWLVRRVPAGWLAVGSLLLTALFKQYVHFPYDDRVFPAYLCYFLLGALCGTHYDRVTAFLRRYTLPLGGIYLAFAAADALLTVRAQVYGAVYPYFEWLHLFYCLAAVAFCFSLSLRLFSGKRLPPLLEAADAATYYVYLAHVLILYIANDLISHFAVTDLFAAFLLRGAFTYLVTFALCMGYGYCKGRLLSWIPKN